MTTDYEKQANDFLHKTGSKLKCVYLRNGRYFAGEKDFRDIYRVTIETPHHTWSFSFGQSIKNSSHGHSNKPTAYDVLACLTKNDVGSFDDFCSEFGYEKTVYNNSTGRDNKNKEAFGIYKAVVKESENLMKAWPKASAMEELQEIS